jgi:predicted phage terminase large subunit-like protein
MTPPQIREYIAIREEIRRQEFVFDSWLKETSPHLEWDLPHLKYMRKDFDDIVAGKPKKIMEFAPPQHGKSTQNSIHFPAYAIYKNPNSRIVVAANRQDFANKFSRRIRDLARNYIPLSKERKAVSEWETMQDGSITCGGVIHVGTGLPIDLLIVDDPIKSPEQASSKTYRDKVWDWWEYNIDPRITNRTSIIFTMTRWHQDDLAARILEANGSEWEIRCLPGICEIDNDPIGRKIGEALWPERWPIEELLKRKGRKSFQALIQQRPSAVEGELFKRDDFVYFSAIPEFKLIVQSIDTASKANKTNDYTVCTTWGVTDKAYYLLHVWRKKCLYPARKRAVIALADKFKPNHILIEDKDSGQALIQELRKETDLPVIPINPKHFGSSKEDRAERTLGAFEAERVLFPKEAQWLSDFIEELAMFPNARHDDQVDSVTQFLNWITSRRRRRPSLMVL